MGGSNGKLNMKQPPRMKSEAEVANTETPKGGIFRLIDPRSPLTEVNRTPIAVPKSKLDASDDLSGMDATVSPPADLTATPSAEMSPLKSEKIDDAPGTKDMSDTEDVSGTKDVSDTEDVPGTNNASDTEDAPGTNNVSDAEDAPHANDASDTEDTPGTNNASDTEDAPNADNVPDVDDVTVTDPVATPLAEIPPSKPEEVDDSDALSTDDVKENREAEDTSDIEKCTPKAPHQHHLVVTVSTFTCEAKEGSSVEIGSAVDQFVAAELMKDGYESEEAREESEYRAYGVPARMCWRVEPELISALMSDDTLTVDDAMKQLYQKLEYAAFNSYDTRPDHPPRPILVDMPLRRNGVTDRLIDILEKWLLYSANSHIKVVLVFDAPAEAGDDKSVVWEHWRYIYERLRCNDRLGVCLRFGSSIANELLDFELCCRWRGEKLYAIWLKESAFVSDDEQKSESPPRSAMTKGVNSKRNRQMESGVAKNKLKVIDAAKRIWMALMLNRNFSSAIIGSRDSDACLQRWFNAATEALTRMHYDEGGDYLRQPYQLNNNRTKRILCDADCIREQLQPQSLALSSALYDSFLVDSEKYKRYYDALVCALKAIIERRRRAGDRCDDYDKSPPLNVLIIGPGARAPLLNQLILAYTAVSMIEGKKYRVRMNVTLAEHNRAAIPKLREFLKYYMTENHMYYYRMALFVGDCRDMPTPSDDSKRAEMIVSEMLGSLGCNELSPDILEECIHRLARPNAVMVPCRYAAYLAPVHSETILDEMRANNNFNFGMTSGCDDDEVVKARQLLYERACNQKPPIVQMLPCNSLDIRRIMHDVDVYTLARLLNTPTGIGNPFDCLWVCNAQQAHQPFYRQPRKVFEFTHAVTNDSKPAECARDWVTLRWESEIDQVLSAMAGYFDCTLYEPNADMGDEDIDDEFKPTLSTHPMTFTENMTSWHAALLPFAAPIHVRRGEIIAVRMRRCTNEELVWYEWQVMEPVQLRVQNERGNTVAMRRRSQVLPGTVRQSAFDNMFSLRNHF